MRSKFSFTVNHFFPGTRSGTRLRVPAIFFILGGDICEIFASPRRDKRLRYLPWTRKTSRERAREYVASKANIADLPSRNDFKLLRLLKATFVEPIMPTLLDFLAPLSHWLPYFAPRMHTQASVRRFP